jgi:RNase adaptor protein for sRNA GlmZ degradation
VFDCRALPNPGRHLEYRHMCGRDAGVVEYIERSAEPHHFWNSVTPLVGAQIEEYLRRGFSSLSVAFGCTGGQHRSVYFAERLAAHIRHQFPQVHVRLEHREQAHWPREHAPDCPAAEPAGMAPANARQTADAVAGEPRRPKAGRA